MTGKPKMESINLKEVTDFFADGDWIESKDQSDTGFRLVQTGNVGIGRYLAHPDRARYISVETFNRLNCTKLNAGDILISRLPDPVGRACLFPGGFDAITAVDCTIVRVKEDLVLPEWVHFITQTQGYQKQVDAMLGGSTRLRITRKELGGIKIPLPPLAEQRKIAEILLTWDEAIETAEAELKAKLERKRVLMQGLFSKKDCGESFEGRYITEIAELSKDRPWGNETVCVDLEHVSPSAGQLIGSLPVNGDEVSKLRFRKDDVLFAKLRPYLKKAWLTDREGICSSEFWVFRAKQDLGDPGFLRQFVLSEPFLEACAASSGSKMPRADWAHVEKIKFMLPSLNEQRVTAGILQAADAEIDAINDFIKLLSTQKRGLMQKLLTGEVRVAV
jgi:type I restriction enzyme S subunit